MLKFVELEQMIFKRHSWSYWPNVGALKFLIFNLLANTWDPRDRFDQSD